MSHQNGAKIALIGIIFLLILTGRLFFNFLAEYSEKTSFIWHLISERKLNVDTYDLVITGDSQVMSGIDPTLLSKNISKSNFKILYYPRPSEQPEGIYLNLLRWRKQGIKYKKILFNISPVTTSKNDIVDSHKSLVKNFSEYCTELFTTRKLNQFYLKDVSGNLYYLLNSIFPFMKMNSNIISETKLIPTTERIDLTSKNINIYLESSMIDNFKNNYQQNQSIKERMIKNNYYWNWNIIKEEERCKNKKSKLPEFMKFAFSIERKEALDMWIQIGEFLTQENIDFYFLLIPFSPETENIVGFRNENSPLQKQVKFLREKFGKDKIIEIDPKIFTEEDFSDFTHLNACGMEKLVDTISKIKSL
jgi:hypothetical protein